jgi:hypothetical protein
MLRRSPTLAIGLFGPNYRGSLETVQLDALGPATTGLFALKSEVSHVVAMGCVRSGSKASFQVSNWLAWAGLGGPTIQGCQ